MKQSPEQLTQALPEHHAKVKAQRVRVIEGPDVGAVATTTVERSISIGTAAGNDLQLTDLAVSRYHLELTSVAGGTQVRDLGSLNGTYIGDARIELARLPVGTRLRIGTTTLELTDSGAHAPKRALARVEVPGMIAVSEPMQSVARTIHKLAPTMVSILIDGETGSGKEVAARAIHQLSPRASAPFIVVDCASLPPNLIGSELFGHERGAFTGADRLHIGAFERARGGTVFLDEVGELPLEVQPVLLGVLERRRLRRVGGEQEIEVDVRVLSATNRDLREGANRGTFRPDLYFRLAVTRLTLPPLRQRAEDIPALIQHFAQNLVAHDDAHGGLDAKAVEALAAQHFPGNVRELRNIVETAVALGDAGYATMPWGGSSAVLAADPPNQLPPSRGIGAIVPYREARAAATTSFERTYLTELLSAFGGNASAAARAAQMDRPYLLNLLRRHGLR